MAITYKLSAFHTAFNICNVLILIWFIKPIEKIVCWVIKPKEDEEEFRLRFITGGLLSTAELSIVQARKEINLFAERTRRMFGMVRDLLHTSNEMISISFSAALKSMRILVIIWNWRLPII